MGNRMLNLGHIPKLIFSLKATAWVEIFRRRSVKVFSELSVLLEAGTLRLQVRRWDVAFGAVLCCAAAAACMGMRAFMWVNAFLFLMH